MGPEYRPFLEYGQFIRHITVSCANNADRVYEALLAFTTYPVPQRMLPKLESLAITVPINGFDPRLAVLLHKPVKYLYIVLEEAISFVLLKLLLLSVRAPNKMLSLMFRFPGNDWVHNPLEEDVDGLFGSFVENATALESFELGYAGNISKTLPPLARLRNLQRLELAIEGADPPPSLSDFPGSFPALKALTLETRRNDCEWEWFDMLTSISSNRIVEVSFSCRDASVMRKAVMYTAERWHATISVVVLSLGMTDEDGEYEMEDGDEEDEKNRRSEVPPDILWPS